MSEQPQTLEINVHEEIKIKDIPPGGAASQEEESQRREKIIAETNRLLGRYVAPHNKKSRWVKAVDISRVLSDGKDMLALCGIPRGLAMSARAIAHPQIDDQDPLRFFVLPSGMVIINPVILTHTQTPVFKDNEGCMSYPDRPAPKNFPRYNKVTVTYQTLGTKGTDKTPVLTRTSTETLNGGPAHIFQHECGHLNGSNMFDADYDPKKSIGLGDGTLVTPDMWDEQAAEELPDKKTI